MSLFLYPRQFPWGMVRDNLEKAATQDAQSEILKLVGPHLSASAARGLAFDTWLDQRDHGDHESNILFGYDDCSPQDAGFVFLDYAFSMGMTGGEESWANGAYLLAGESPFPPLMLSRLDRDILNETIVQIENYPDDKLEEIVERVPDPYFRPGERGPILAGLRERRSHLRGFLSSRLTAKEAP